MNKKIVPAALAVIMLMAGVASAAPNLKALIIDGRNNHNWQETTPQLKMLLEKTGLFSVDVATAPPKKESLESFKPDFAKYDVLVMNYAEFKLPVARWPKETETAFLNFVRDGGGVVIVHAADNAFPNWPEYNELIGVGGWGGRTEKDGPMIRWRNGRMVLVDEPGKAGQHGPKKPFQVVVRNLSHPITKGLPEKWMHSADELYSTLRGPAKNVTLLATAYADPDNKGTGEHEPILFTIAYGKGRVFHTVLGHSVEQGMNCVGFACTFQRGAEWAATGKVTLPVPANFPTADKVSLLGDAPAKAAAAVAAPSGGFQSIKKFSETTDQAERAAIEKQIFQCPAAQVPILGKELAAILQSPETTHEGKVFACRMLRFISPECAVPALAALLPDSKMSHMARFALQGIDDPAAEKALIDALGKVSSPLKPGIIDSLAQRRASNAVKAIAPLMNSKDANTVLAAINALGRIGTGEAAAALAAAKVPMAFSNDWKRAQLNCAALLTKGNPTAATAIFQQLYSKNNPDPIRAAALVGLSKADAAKTTPEVLAQLNSENKLIKRTSIGLLNELPVGSLIGGMGKLSPENQVLVIHALADRRETAAEKAMLNLTKSIDASVKAAAFAALGRIGGAGSVQPLLEASKAGNTAAFDSLCALNADGVYAAILKQFGTADDATKAKLIEALALRKATEAIPVLFKTAEGTWSRSCKAAIDAIGTIGTETDFPAIADLMLKTDDGSKLKACEDAILTAAQRITNLDACSAPLAAAYAQASGEAKYAIARALGSLGGKQSLTILTAALKDSDAKLKDAAVRGLASWPNKDVADQLLDLAKNTDSEIHQVLALRGYIRLADNLSMYKKAAAVTDRPAELKSIIGGAAKFENVPAHEFISGFLGNEAVSKEARQAIKKIEGSKGYKKSNGKAVKQKPKAGKKNTGKKGKKKPFRKAAAATGVNFNPPKNAVIFDAKNAKINGKGANYEKGENRLCIGGWKEVKTWFSWPADLKPGSYRVSVATSMGGQSTSDFEVEIAGQKLNGKIVKTAGWHDFPLVVIGEINIAKAGPCQVAFRPLKKSGTYVGNLRAVVLEKVK